MQTAAFSERSRDCMAFFAVLALPISAGVQIPPPCAWDVHIQHPWAGQNLDFNAPLDLNVLLGRRGGSGCALPADALLCLRWQPARAPATRNPLHETITAVPACVRVPERIGLASRPPSAMLAATAAAAAAAAAGSSPPIPEQWFKLNTVALNGI